MIDQIAHDEQVYARCMRALRDETIRFGQPTEQTVTVMCKSAWYAWRQYFPETERVIAGIIQPIQEIKSMSLIELELHRTRTRDGASYRYTIHPVGDEKPILAFYDNRTLVAVTCAVTDPGKPGGVATIGRHEKYAGIGTFVKETRAKAQVKPPLGIAYVKTSGAPDTPVEVEANAGVTTQFKNNFTCFVHGAVRGLLRRGNDKKLTCGCWVTGKEVF